MRVLLLALLILVTSFVAFRWLVPEAATPPGASGAGVGGGQAGGTEPQVATDGLANGGGDPAGGSSGDPRAGSAVATPRGSVFGRVFGRDGAPLAGAVVRIAVDDVVRAVHTAATGTDGEFSLQAPVAAPCELTVVARGHAPARLTVPGGCDVPFEIRLMAGAAVEGTVRDALRRPVPMAAVELFAQAWAHPAKPDLGPVRPPHGELRRRATTDRDGRYRLEDLAAEPVLVMLGPGAAGAAAPVQLAAGMTTTVDLQVAAPARVLGHVTGVALGGVTGEVCVDGGPRLRRRVPIDADGNYQVDGLPPGRYLIAATTAAGAARMTAAGTEYAAQGHTSLATRIDLAAGATLRLDLAAEPVTAGAIEGTAFVGGAQAVGHRVTLVAADAAIEVAVDEIAATEVDAQGAFVFVDVPVGEFELRLTKPGVPVAEPLARMRCRITLGEVAQVAMAAP